MCVSHVKSLYSYTNATKELLTRLKAPKLNGMCIIVKLVLLYMKHGLQNQLYKCGSEIFLPNEENLFSVTLFHASTS